MALSPLTVPPEITARCLDRAILFSLVKPPGAKGIWELGVDHEPLTPELAAQRGYLLYNDTERTSLEVPVLSIGYQYEVRFNPPPVTQNQMKGELTCSACQWLRHNSAAALFAPLFRPPNNPTISL